MVSECDALVLPLEPLGLLCERQEGVVELERCGASPSRVTAASCPISVKSDRRTEMFGGPLLAVQVAVYPLGGETGGPGLQVAGHEPDRVPTSVLAGGEAVDTLNDVLATLFRIGARDPLALDNRMWIVVMTRFEDGWKEDGDVDAAVGHADALR